MKHTTKPTCKHNTLRVGMQKKKKKAIKPEPLTPVYLPPYKYHVFQTQEYKDLSLGLV